MNKLWSQQSWFVAIVKFVFVTFCKEHKLYWSIENCESILNHKHAYGFCFVSLT
jgi:hypothetical protein